MQLKIEDALLRFEELTEAGVSSRIKFYKYNGTTGEGGQIKVVEKAFIRRGYRRTQSAKSGVLVAYRDLDTEEERQFYAPLLCGFNNYDVQ